MKANGFTLIELIGIVSLIAVIILVAVPSLVDSNEKALKTKETSFEDTVSQACIDYLEVNSEEYKDLFEGTKKSVSIDIYTLISEGYLKTNLKNPYKDNAIITDKTGEKVIAQNNAGEIECEYKEATK